MVVVEEAAEDMEPSLRRRGGDMGEMVGQPQAMAAAAEDDDDQGNGERLRGKTRRAMAGEDKRCVAAEEDATMVVGKRRRCDTKDEESGGERGERP